METSGVPIVKMGAREKGVGIDCDWPTVVLLLDKNLIEVSEDCGKI